MTVPKSVKMIWLKVSRAFQGNWYSTDPTAIMMPPVGTPKACGLTVRYWKPRRLPKLPAKNRS